jgi:stage II sporulation protein D
VKRGAALLAAALVVVGCFGGTPRTQTGTGTRADPAVRIALGVARAGEVPERLTPSGTDFVRFKGKRYRGTLRTINTDSGVLVVNTVPLEQYLKGVVPLELGERPAAERAAMEAQAVAARSYTVSRLIASRGGRGRSEHYDLVPSTADQVYGGADAERPNASAAVEATRGLVLRYGDRVIAAPYSSACGGETATAQEAWAGSAGEPYLQRVSDKMPGRDVRYYCDIAPRFYWERSLTGDELDAVVARYLRSVTRVPSGGPGAVQAIRVAERFPSGRVRVLELRTAAGTFDVAGNPARNVLRTPAGEPLPSSYFSVSAEQSASSITRVVLRGNGYGHGVGMCQWGAIGRARAGQNVEMILRTYFPGTTLGSIPSL